MPEKSATTTVVLERELVIYKRERSSIWQCRCKAGGVWQRTSTKERDIKKAATRAKELLIEANYRLRDNVPVITRKFRNVAQLAIRRMEEEEKAGKGKASFVDYKRIINDYLIPCLGKRNITNIDYAALNEFDAWRIERMGKAPGKSTLFMHNAALNRVFDEAIIRGFMVGASKPELDTKGKGRIGNRRAAFEMVEMQALFAGFDDWIKEGRNAHAREVRELMRDYVAVLFDTGTRPGKELMNLRWQQIQEQQKPTVKATGQKEVIDGVEEAVERANLNRSVLMYVDRAKTKARQIMGRADTVNALKRIALRNYDKLETPIIYPLQNVARANNADYVFRLKDKSDVRSTFQHMFENYLKEHNLLIDPITGQKRVLYSLRHTYATFMILYDKAHPATLVKQMGTSLPMLEKHYSHLEVAKAMEHLRGEEMRQLINSGGAVDEMYKSKKQKRTQRQKF